MMQIGRLLAHPNVQCVPVDFDIPVSSYDRHSTFFAGRMVTILKVPREVPLRSRFVDAVARR